MSDHKYPDKSKHNMAMKQILFSLLITTGLLSGCADVPNNTSPKYEPKQVESLNTIGASSDPATIQSALQGATEICKKQGKKIVVIDTRTASYQGVGALAYGDIKYICAPE